MHHSQAVEARLLREFGNHGLESLCAVDLAASAAVIVILIATLVPVEIIRTRPLGISGLSIPPLADLVRNLVLFTPLGIALGLRGSRTTCSKEFKSLFGQNVFEFIFVNLMRLD